jgi:hypothetical protein
MENSNNPLGGGSESAAPGRSLALSSDVLRKLEAMDLYFNTPTGDSTRDEYYQFVRGMFASPDSSGPQEKILAEALGSTHKGSKKLGADAQLDGREVEIKPCKSERPVTSVNITDDQPARLLKDMQTPDKLLVIGRCPGGIRFRWVVVCLLHEFAESRYRAMCKHFKHVPESWPGSLDEQRALVQRLAETRTKNNYVRSSQLKFASIQTILGSWVHPELDQTKLSRRIEDAIVKRIVGTQTSAPPTASSHPGVPVLAL